MGFYNHGDFFKADYLQMLSVLGPYCVDSRINNEYGATGRIKIGRRNRSTWREPTLHHFVVDKMVLWQFLQLLQFPLSIFIPLIVPHSSVILSSMQYHPNEPSE
jgi:hypothetical protein